MSFSPQTRPAPGGRLGRLGRYQKGVLLLLGAMTLLFTALYLAAAARKGFLYQNTILAPAQTDAGVVYAGRLRGGQARFTVSADRTVTFQYGGQTYGPYTAREDPSAVPQGHEASGYMTGVELFCGGELLFRGGVLDLDGRRWLYNADGSLADAVTVTVTYGNQGAVVLDEDGHSIDPMEPSASVILDLMAGPALTHKGVWPLWACGVLLCALTAVSILFADELFRLGLALRIRDADRAQPANPDRVHSAGVHAGAERMQPPACGDPGRAAGRDERGPSGRRQRGARTAASTSRQTTKPSPRWTAATI